MLQGDNNLNDISSSSQWDEVVWQLGKKMYIPQEQVVQMESFKEVSFLKKIAYGFREKVIDLLDQWIPSPQQSVSRKAVEKPRYSWERKPLYEFPLDRLGANIAIKEASPSRDLYSIKELYNRVAFDDHNLHERFLLLSTAQPYFASHGGIFKNLSKEGLLKYIKQDDVLFHVAYHKKSEKLLGLYFVADDAKDYTNMNFDFSQCSQELKEEICETIFQQPFESWMEQLLLHYKSKPPADEYELSYNKKLFFQRKLGKPYEPWMDKLMKYDVSSLIEKNTKMAGAFDAVVDPNFHQKHIAFSLYYSMLTELQKKGKTLHPMEVYSITGAKVSRKAEKPGEVDVNLDFHVLLEKREAAKNVPSRTMLSRMHTEQIGDNGTITFDYKVKLPNGHPYVPKGSTEPGKAGYYDVTLEVHSTVMMLHVDRALTYLKEKLDIEA